MDDTRMRVYEESILPRYGSKEYVSSQSQKYQDRAHNHWHRKIKRIFSLGPDPADTKVLDVGCGVGTYALEASRRGSKLAVGIDITFEMLRAGRDLARRQSTDDGAWFVVADAAAMPFSNHSFDFLVASDIVEHLPDQVLTKMLRESRRVLAPSGQSVLHTYPTKFSHIFGEWRYLVMVLPGLLLPQRLLDRYIEWVDQVAIQSISKLMTGKTRDDKLAWGMHCNLQSLSGLVRLVDAAGFSVKCAFAEATSNIYETTWLRRIASLLFARTDYTKRNIYILASRD